MEKYIIDLNGEIHNIQRLLYFIHMFDILKHIESHICIVKPHLTQIPGVQKSRFNLDGLRITGV